MKIFQSAEAFFAIVLPVVFWAAVLGYLIFISDYSAVIFTVLGGMVLRAICEIIYFFYKKQRPYQVLNAVPPHSMLFVSPYKQTPDSFPSAHAAVMLFGAGFLILSNYYFLGSLAFIAALLASYARVKLLYHYWSDIFGGAALAFFWLIFMGFIARI